MASNIDANGIRISQLPYEMSPSGVYVPGVKSERTVKISLDLLATKDELQNAVVGTNILGERADVATIKSEVTTPNKGDTYKALDTGNYWKYNDTISETNPYDPNKWNDIGNIIPSDVALSGGSTLTMQDMDDKKLDKGTYAGTASDLNGKKAERINDDGDEVVYAPNGKTDSLRTGILYDNTGENSYYPTVSSTPKFQITSNSTIKFLTSKRGAIYNNVVFFDSANVFISGLDTDSKTITSDNIPDNAAYVAINQETGELQTVYIDGVIAFNYAQAIKDVENAINKLNTGFASLKSDSSIEKIYTNLLPNINTQDVFMSEYVTFLNPGYLLTANSVTGVGTTNLFNFSANRRVALCVKIKFDFVTDDFRLQFGFNTEGWDKSSPDYMASDFGLTNLTGTTQVFVLKWDATKASYPYFFIYKAEVEAGQTQTYTIEQFAVLDLGENEDNELYNKTENELKEIFSFCIVSDAKVFYSKIVVPVAEVANSIASDAILNLNKNYGKKLVTIGDSLTANVAWQPKLQSITGLKWSVEETVNGVGYVHLTTGEYTTDDKSADADYRKAYEMAIGGSVIQPTNVGSIYMRSFDAVFYKPEIIFLYGGQNDIISIWKTTGNVGITPEEIVKNEIPYKANAINTNVSVIAAYKGMVENLMESCPSAIIYLVTQMRVLGRVGMQNASGVVRFPTIQDVVDWEMTERFPKVQYIREIGKLYGLPVIDLWDKTGVTDYNAEYWYGEPASDCTQVHPEVIGYYRMSDVMEQCL